ncbi:hypothetical protein CLOM_g16178 [Closterium sp. NIES-68]|nr:hypothetical protein CLOM_g16178 [Closterium sp. NIES-68]
MLAAAGTPVEKVAVAERPQAAEMAESPQTAETESSPQPVGAGTPQAAEASAPESSAEPSAEASAEALAPEASAVTLASASAAELPEAGRSQGEANLGGDQEQPTIIGDQAQAPARSVLAAPSIAARLAPKGPITDARNGQDAANTSARHRELVDATGQLLFLASRGIVDGVIDLLDRGVSPDLADYDGRTALHLAASEGKVDVVRLLLERGADVNPKDRHGNTPLADAQSYGSAEICRLLKDNGGLLCESARIRNAASNSFGNHDYEIDGSEIDLGMSKVIGEGSFGEVRLASWRGTPIAVKVLRDEYAADPAALNEFRQELRILQSLRHPNIVQFLGAVTKSRPRMIVTEYLKVNLRDVIRKKGALPAQEALRYALDVARGMCYLHAHRPDPVIHRDLTPSNLLRDDSGHLKVADFGLSSIRATAAAPLTPSTGMGGMGMGMGASNIVSLFQPTFSRRLVFSKHSHRLYSAPELLAQQEYGKSVDVYSFGVILFEMFEGYDKIRQLLPGGTNHGGNLFPLALSSSSHSNLEHGAEGGAGGSHHSGGGATMVGGVLGVEGSLGWGVRRREGRRGVLLLGVVLLPVLVPLLVLPVLLVLVMRVLLLVVLLLLLVLVVGVRWRYQQKQRARLTLPLPSPGAPTLWG